VTEVWTTDQVAQHLGIEPRSVRKTMSRWGIAVSGREPGRAGANLYPADEVRAGKSASQGKGNRTFRKLTAAQLDEIRSAHGQRTSAEVAADYGVSSGYVRALWAERHRQASAQSE
jgi:hypothetical protein